MKKSSITVSVALGMILVFFFAFQMSMKRHFHKAEEQLNQKEIQTEMRTLTSFQGIEVDHGIHVKFLQNRDRELKITAGKRQLASIGTRIVDRVLIVEKTNRIKVNDSILVYISNHELNFLKVSNGATFQTINEVTGERIDLEVSSDSRADLEITYDIVHCKAASGSQVNITGNSNQIDFSN